MVRRSSEEIPDEEFAPEVPAVNTREVVSIRQTLDELGNARCPLCRGVLVARQGRTGPYFYCQCVRAPTRRAS
jgi:ssDNA-binding Zn-finger/Zn-ribbon topoisomerase 1